MVERWVHLTELGGDPWILPVWSAMNQAVQAGRVAPLERDLIEVGMHISIRLNFLPRIVRRVNAAVQNLYGEVSERNPEHEFARNTEGIALDVDDDLKYELLVDLDSLLFEFNSVCELTNTLFERLHDHIGRPMPRRNAGLSMRSILEANGEDTSWFVVLDTNRNFFMHEGAPYVAVDISNAPQDYDLLIMKENLKVFDDTRKFVKLSEIKQMVQGFRRSRPILQIYLRSLFT